SDPPTRVRATPRPVSTDTRGVDSPGRRWRPSVRARVLGAVLVLTAFGVLMAGVSAHLTNRDRTEQSITEVLLRSVTEFQRLATDGEDPETGAPFTTASRLVYVALQRMVPAADEGMLGYVDGKRRWDAPVTVAVRLEEDPELLAHLDAYDPSQPGTVRRVTTSTTTWSYAAVPVSSAALDTPDSAMFVAAVDVDAVFEPVEATFRTFLLFALAVFVLVG